MKKIFVPALALALGLAACSTSDEPGNLGAADNVVLNDEDALTDTNLTPVDGDAGGNLAGAELGNGTDAPLDANASVANGL